MEPARRTDMLVTVHGAACALLPEPEVELLALPDSPDELTCGDESW